MPQPNLLLAGFVKCGTTSLAKYLAHHPAVLVPAAKELYYLVDGDSPLASMRAAIDRMSAADRCLKPGPCRYSDYFPTGAGERYALDATPHYYSQTAALEYARAQRNAKLVFMIRDPVARVVSSFRFFRGMFQEYPAASFEGFVEALLDMDGKRDAYRRRIRKAFFRYLFDVELDMGCFERHFARWRSVVDDKRMFIGTMEEIRDNPRQLMRRLCSFLDLDAAIYDTFHFTPYMQSYAVRSPLLQRLSRRVGREDLMRYDRLDRHHSPFHRVVNDSARRVLDGIYQTIQVGRGAEIDRRAAERLYDFYLPHNLRLRDRYGIDYVAPGRAAEELRPASATALG
jgi:Sulfotransferase domain